MKRTRLKKQLLSMALIIVILISLSACRYSKKNKHKVLLIGLDGASWNVMLPLIEKGKLPNIKQLMDQGCWGTLKTFEPLESEVIWTTIATGKDPQKHGIVNRLMGDSETGECVPPSSNLREVKSLWNILSESKKKVGIVNYMVTRPAEKVNGVMISGGVVDINDLDYLAKDRSYPNFTKICSQVEFEKFKNIEQSIFSSIDKNRFPNFWWQIETIDNCMVNFSMYLLQKKKFDFFCLYIRGIDVASHNFWQFLFPEGFNIPGSDIQRYKDVINNYYVWCDGIIGDILKKAGKNTSVFVVSDHGFRMRPKDEYLFSKVDYLLEVCGINKMSKVSKGVLLKNEPADLHSFTKNIKIIGNLSEKEFNEVREEAKNILKNIRIVETYDYLFKDIKDTESGFSIRPREPYMRKESEYHIVINQKEHRIMDFLISHAYPGAHSTSAIIITSGEHICRNKKIETATIYDIAPTVLYYMGLPVGRDMDGKVLTEAIEEEYLKRNPVRYIETYDTNKKETLQKPIRSPLDEEKIKEKMRSLGYIN